MADWIWTKRDKIQLPINTPLTVSDSMGLGNVEGKGREGSKAGSSGFQPSEPEQVPMPESLAKIMPSLKRVRLDNPGELYSSWSQAYPDVGIVQEIPSRMRGLSRRK